MNSLPYPLGCARAVAQARASGLKPAQPVLIDLGGGAEWANPTCHADPKRHYRWDWVRGLNIVVLIHARTGLGDILHDIDIHEPCQIDVIDPERRLGWLVNFTRPILRTCRWPRRQVDDWLGDGHWHKDLHDCVAQARQQASLRAGQQQEPQEAVWT